MTRRIIERVFASVGVIFGASTLIFLILRWLPGDPAALVAGDGASAETIRRLQAQLGSDRPIARQYLEYMAGLLRGDLGTSYVTHEPVLRRLSDQFPATATLALAACVVAIAVGLGLGLLSALHEGLWIDRAVQAFALVVVSVPPFWLGILLILIFSVRLRLFPVIGEGSVASAVLPVTCLGLVASVPLLRLVRSGVAEGIHEPYVTTLRAKGLGARRTLYIHVLRNVLIATITMVSVICGELLSGVVIVETLFARQGIGRLTVEAITQKDMPVVQGAILLASFSYVAVNLLVDLSYAFIDPRTRAASERSAP